MSIDNGGKFIKIAPLTPLSDSTTDEVVLTPLYFMTGLRKNVNFTSYYKNAKGSAVVAAKFKFSFFLQFAGKRIKYKDKDKTFLEKHLASKEPFGQFKAWFEEAFSRKEILEPNAMCLATVSKDGFPSARLVMCRDYGKDGFKFFTNFGSRKASEMDCNPNVAATFYWEILNRSVRIEGCVEKLDEAESTKYFHSRPVLSQIAACTSFQSTPIESRDILCEREAILEAEYMIPGKEVPKPSFWGGYIIHPRAVEFWQGQRDRLHDRIKFRKPKEGEVPNGKLLHEGEDGWVYERLSP